MQNVISFKHTYKDVNNDGPSYNDHQDQEWYYIAYYFVLTSKIFIAIHSKRSNHEPMSVTSVV